ncbi:hypothetical protein K474DRAFT_1656927 [Panus rudis PR-1116 ss-1]|nr:hypothetical protein K474DRAFT_1656927 [Panus rudis PR-1116 ss-1]
MKEKEKKEKKEKEKEKKPTLRELAIQPTQRVMRYVLQYRSTSLSFPHSSLSLN